MLQQTNYNLELERILSQKKVKGHFSAVILVHSGSSVEEVLKPEVIKVAVPNIADQPVVVVSQPNRPSRLDKDMLYFEFL